MALTGTGYGSDLDSTVTGVWDLRYNLQLKGRIVGLSTFTPVATDGTPGTATTYAINTVVKPMSCTKISERAAVGPVLSPHTPYPA